MKIFIKTLFLTLLIHMVVGCQKSDKKQLKIVSEEFGNWRNDDQNLGVELRVNDFKNFKELLNKVEQIVCNDSLPKIIIRKENEIKTTYIINPCPANFRSVLIKYRNIIQIHNDTIIKSEKLFYPLDSLEKVLERDLTNNGKNPKLSDSAESYFIYLSYTHDGINRVPKIIDELTRIYKKVTNKTDIKIWLNERNEHQHKIPQMPTEPKEIELIKEAA